MTDKSINDIVKELEDKVKIITKEASNTELEKIKQMTIERVKWYSNGLCYKCGGFVTFLRDNVINSEVVCRKCGQKLYYDAVWDYYFMPVIDYILEKAGTSFKKIREECK